MLCHGALLASTNAQEPRGSLPCPCAFAWTSALAPGHMAAVPNGCCVLPLPRTWTSLAHKDVQPVLCVGRYEGTEMFLGHRNPGHGSLSSPSRWRETRNKCVVPPHDGRASREKPRQNTLPEEDCARAWPAEKRTKSALRESLSLDNGGPHKGSALDGSSSAALSLARSSKRSLCLS